MERAGERYGVRRGPTGGAPVLAACACLVLSAASAFPQDAAVLVGQPLTAIQVEQEGKPVRDEAILALVETKVGDPLSMAAVRETLDHLDGLGRFDDVRVVAEASGGGVLVKYLLMPAHPVRKVLFRGALGLSESELRQAVVEKHGAFPRVGRADEVVRTLRALYRDHGYLKASITPRVEQRHDPDRSSLIFVIEAGPRALVRSLRVEGLDGPDQAALLGRLGVTPGRSYDTRELRSALTRYQNDLRSRGYYEARADPSTDYTPDGGAVITIAVERGPHVVVVFAGDPLPRGVSDQLVPVRQEGSVDEDLLENASIAIQDYLKARGYRDAIADHVRSDRGGELVITFTVARGPRYVIDAVDPKGNQAISVDELRAVMKPKAGEPFVQAALDGAGGAVRQFYQSRGFTRARVEIVTAVLPQTAADGEHRVQVLLEVIEGASTIVGAIAIDGNKALSDAEIRGFISSAPGRPYSQVQVASDQHRIETEYLNRGYETAVVDPRPTLTLNDGRADVRFAISEGLQVIVDHVIIIGNQRTSSATIERELLLRPGQPLGYAAMVDSQQRLSSLGLFRRVRITGRRHGSAPRRDVIVDVEEAPPTSIGYGGGLEGGRRLRPATDGGQAVERVEIAPRGFFEVGRRNLWGKNRSINLFTRLSLRARDVATSSQGLGVERPADSSYGFNEYRVVGTYREPKIFSSPADLLVNAILDQSVRSSFNVRTRELAAQAGWRLSPRYNLTGAYTFRAITLFDERFSEAEKPLIDRLFPRVNISMLAATILRDTRSDVLDPDHGTFLALENDFAARAYGSEVGFAKTYVQAFWFHLVPSQRRMVLAMAARVGAAHGFPRSVSRLDARGAPMLGPDGHALIDVVEDLPASERFFAGGDTTVRGFSLDRLGDKATVAGNGFPTGGNGVVVLNAELRVAALRGFQAVGFFDAGNVFLKASSFDVTNLRPAAGFGVRYKSPIGPIRVDWGFNLKPRDLVPASLDGAGVAHPAVQERRNVLHISLGQAF